VIKANIQLIAFEKNEIKKIEMNQQENIKTLLPL